MHYLIKVVDYWYYFFVASAITIMFNLPDWFSLLVVTIVLVGINSIMVLKWKTMDFVVLISMLYCIVSYAFSDYSFSFYYYGIKNQLCMMFFYFIGRVSCLDSNGFIDNMKWPMTIVIVAGILLYFFPPSWYISFRYSFIQYAEGTASFYEYSRMSSFFLHPYFLGFGSCFFVIYLVKCILIDSEYTTGNYCLLLLALFTLVFSQMRVAIAYTLLFLCFTSFYTIIGNQKNKSFLKFIVILVLLSIILYFVLSKTINTDFMDYIMNRTTQKEGNLIEERFNQFSDYYKYISFWGNGLGRFGHYAEKVTHISIADNDYIRLLSEVGYIGTIVILIPIFYSIIRGFTRIRKCFFETFTLLFFPFAMLGATPLEVPNQHVFLLWFCVGLIITKTTPKYDIMFLHRLKMNKHIFI